MKYTNKNWDAVINYIRSSTTQIAFDTWVKPLVLSKIDEKNEPIYVKINIQNNKNAAFILQLL